MSFLSNYESQMITYPIHKVSFTKTDARQNIRNYNTQGTIRGVFAIKRANVVSSMSSGASAVSYGDMYGVFYVELDAIIKKGDKIVKGPDMWIVDDIKIVQDIETGKDDYKKVYLSLQK